MTKAQLITALETAYNGISNTASLTQAQAQSKMATEIGTAVDAFVASNSPDKTGSIKSVLTSLVSELQKQRITLGTNLNQDRLIDILETINDI